MLSHRISRRRRRCILQKLEELLDLVLDEGILVVRVAGLDNDERTIVGTTGDSELRPCGVFVGEPELPHTFSCDRDRVRRRRQLAGFAERPQVVRHRRRS